MADPFFLVSCGEVLVVDATLDSDLNCSGTALHIGAPGIILDLGGYTISGDGTPNSRGVNNLGHDFVTIRNGSVTNFEAGVWFSGDGVTDSEVTALSLVGNDRGVFLNAGSHRNRLYGNTVTESSVTGIALNDSDDNLVELNTLVDNSFSAVELFAGSAHNEVSENRIAGGGAGIFQSVTDSNSIVENTIANPGNSGIVLFAANNGVVLGNRVTGATSYGITSAGSSGNSIENNRLTGNGVSGINLRDNSDNNSVKGNKISDNTSRGIEILSPDSEGNTVTRNKVRANGTGIQVFLAHNTIVSRNHVRGNSFDGITVNAGSTGTLVFKNHSHRNGLTEGPWDGIDVDAPDTTLTENKANFNTQFGISAVPGVVDGGGNRAKHNGNPVECLNVACE